MDRREFLKDILLMTAIAPAGAVFAAAADREKGEKAMPEISRRKFKDFTLPLLGFGMMRLPRIKAGEPEIDLKSAAALFDRAMKSGINYFDTAYFYHSGLSEKCAGELLKRYPRQSYLLADKMPVSLLKSADDVERIWNEQLERCQVDYFDFYLLHSLNRNYWEKVKKFNVIAFLEKKKAEGKIRNLGFSFHDEPAILQEIAASLKWDFAQIQLNYLDWSLYRSKEQYEILTKLGIPVIVMEPLRGGALAALNPKADAILKKAAPDASIASWAFRYVASLPNVVCILSGMNRMDHLEENISTLSDFKPLDAAERRILDQALTAYRSSGTIPCTGCSYCMPCAVGVNIPRIFGLYNQYKINGRFGSFMGIYNKMPEDERASACVQCQLCVRKCPQQINIPEQLEKIANEIASRAELEEQSKKLLS